MINLLTLSLIIIVFNCITADRRIKGCSINTQPIITNYYRFDLIFLMLDPQDESFDRRLATHLVSLYYRNGAKIKAESIVSKYRGKLYTLYNA